MWPMRAVVVTDLQLVQLQATGKEAKYLLCPPFDCPTSTNQILNYIFSHISLIWISTACNIMIMCSQCKESHSNLKVKKKKIDLFHESRSQMCKL